MTFKVSLHNIYVTRVQFQKSKSKKKYFYDLITVHTVSSLSNEPREAEDFHESIGYCYQQANNTPD